MITFYELITGFKLQAEHFLVSLSNEVSARLQTAAARGKTITLKVLNLHAVMCENKGLASPCSD